MIVGLVVRGLIFYQAFIFLSSFFRQLLAELAERNSTIFGHMVGSNLKIHVRNLGYPIPYKPGAQKPLFCTTSQLNGNFSSLYLTNETLHGQSGSALTTRGLLHRLKTIWTLVYKRLQIGSEFSPTLRKICIPLHCQASQTEISKRKSTTLCQTVG